MYGAPLLFIQNLHWSEILLILLVILLLFGAKRIPEVARSLGKGIKEFKKGLKEASSELEEEDEGKAEGKKSGSPPLPPAEGGGGKDHPPHLPGA